MGQDVAVLANPIERIVYTDSLPDEVFCISGVNALSEYSMLNKEKMTLMPLQKKKLDGCKSGQTRNMARPA